MRLLHRILITLATALLPAFIVQAGIPDLRFRRLDTRDGLSNSQVLCVLRDSKGIVWMGTPYGLNRYDGYRVKTFYSDLRDTTTLRTNYVDAIFESYDGRIWLKQGMGYSIFSPAFERCDRHPEQWLEKQGMTGGLEYVFIDSRKDFWVKTYNNGFYHYNPQTGKIAHFRFGYGDQEFNSDIGVSSMAEDGNMVFLASSNGEIICFDRDKDVIVRKESYLRENGLTRDQGCKLRIDGQGNVWVITQPVAYIWNPKNGQWIHSVQALLHGWGFTDVPEEMAVWDMLADDKQRLWFATDHSGLFVADIAGKELKQFLSGKNDETTISDNTLRNIMQDQLGRVWIGTYTNGVNLYTGNTSSFRNLELGNINTICYDKAGITWLGTNDAGIIRYNSWEDEKTYYNKENSPIASNTMVGSFAASDGSVWFGTYEGGLIHIKDGEVTNYRATNDTLGLASNNVWTVCDDQWGNIWIGTLGGGVQRIDKRTGQMRTFRMSNSQIPSDYISTVTRTKKGWLLVGHSAYFSLINPKTFRIVNLGSVERLNEVGGHEISIVCMEDSRQLIWQGSTSGASVMDPKTNRYYLLDMRSGLFGSTVNSIVEDDSHTMWLVTDHGISNVIPQQQDDGRWTFIVRSYNNRDGLQDGPYNQRSAVFTKAGLLLAGGQDGLDILNPKGNRDRVKEKPLFSGLLLFEKEVVIGERIDGRVILEKALGSSRRLKLRYNDQFTIQLSSNSGELHNRSRFIYRLEGFNDNWVRTSEQNPNISYMSLPAGTYTLCVRMLNDDGTMGEDESRLEIVISPPFYRSWWAVMLYLLCAIGGAWWWFRRTKRRHAEHIELENQRRELEKLQWMSEMRAQMAGQEPVEAPQPKPMCYLPELGELVEFVKKHVEDFAVPADKQSRLTFQSSLNRLTMNFDPDLLGQLIDILLQNAVKFSPRGSKIRTTLSEVDNQAVIRVADRGLGVPDEARKHMFDMHIEPGIGLGTVRQIAELHGGSVHAEDNPGGGTVVIVSLPTVAGTYDDTPIQEAEIIE